MAMSSCFFNTTSNDAHIAVESAGLDKAFFDGVVRLHDPRETLVLVEAQRSVFHEETLSWIADWDADSSEQTRA